MITFGITPKTKPIFSKIPVFPLIFFPDMFENYWEIFTFNLPKVPTRFTFLPEKILMKKIRALLLPLNVVTDTKKEKKTHTIVKSIYSSFRSKSKRNNLLY